MRPSHTAPYHPENTADAARIAQLRSMRFGIEHSDDPLPSMTIVAYLMVAAIGGTVGGTLVWWFLS